MSQVARTAANGRHARPHYFTVLYSRVATNARSIVLEALAVVHARLAHGADLHLQLAHAERGVCAPH